MKNKFSRIINANQRRCICWTSNKTLTVLKANGVPVCWLIIAGYLEEMFHGQNISAIYALLHFR